MTLTEFEVLRDDNLGDTAPASPSTPLRDPICDRIMFDALLAEAFSLHINDDGAAPSNTITTKVTISGLSYTMRFKKVFNMVFVKGNIRSVSGVSINNVVVANITNSEFIPESGYSQNIHAIREDNTGKVLQLQFQSSGAIKALHSDALVIGVGFEINGFYYVNR